LSSLWLNFAAWESREEETNKTTVKKEKKKKKKKKKSSAINYASLIMCL
jgi:hypothetical protein